LQVLDGAEKSRAGRFLGSMADGFDERPGVWQRQFRGVVIYEPPPMRKGFLSAAIATNIAQPV